MLAMALPQATEQIVRGNRVWKVADKFFVWERPLRAGDLAALGVGPGRTGTGSTSGRSRREGGADR